ncbi:LegC family aminotransferase [Desulfonatronovibrio magnus]|uniref:LegC family aminotransferase n=1 Tax=Desulfonatronovibrio magnus TaxID=698827 RepID=UPI0005EBA360|nr:LegC family aminotransferase [Desulfonatronovibrio magnus]
MRTKDKALSDNICQALAQVLGDGSKPLHEPCFKGNEWEYLKECLDSSFVSSVGKFVDRFEDMLAEYTGAKRAVAVVNGTAALHMSLLLAGVRPGDEVIIQPLTFVATCNAISYLGATPVFVDIDQDILGMSPEALQAWLRENVELREESDTLHPHSSRFPLSASRSPNQPQPFNKQSGRRISAILPMHTFGHPCRIDEIVDICHEYNIPVVEDAAESLGSFYKGIHTGNFGRLGVLSFNGNKTITTGGGGAIITNDEDLADQAKYLTTTAKRPHKWEYFHDRIGYNYRLPNLNAALGCAQMEQLPEFINKKRELASKYEQALESIPGVSFFKEPKNSKSNYWLNTIILDKQSSHSRDDILESTNRAGYMTRPAWTLMHKLPMFKNCAKADLSTAEDLETRIINIPSSPGLCI